MNWKKLICRLRGHVLAGHFLWSNGRYIDHMMRCKRCREMIITERERVP